MKPPPEVEVQRLGGLRWWVRRDGLTDELRALLADPDSALDGSATLLKSGAGRQSTVGAFHGWVLKRFNQNKPLNYFKDLFRPARALRAYLCAERFAALGIATPRVVAAAERRCCRVLWRSYLVAEEVPNDRDLRSIDNLDLNLARQAGDLVGRMHHAGFAHDDLKEANLIVNAAGQVYVLDLDGVDDVQVVSWRQAAKDLTRLARGAAPYPFVRRIHRRAFLRAYCRARGLRRVPRQSR